MFRLLARNVSTRYLAYVIDAALGLLMLPFNVEHLGKPLYGLWILIASLTVSFGLLDIGFAGSMVRFIARYRASRDSRALNEILSTLFVVYSVIGAVTFGVAMVLQMYLDRIFTIDPAHVATAKQALLIASTFVAIRFCSSVFGAVVVGFQRYYLNNVASIITSVSVAVVNVAVLLAGFSLVGLVAATTAVRILGLLLYRRNAYIAFPGLRLRAREFSRARLREVSGFSVYMLLLDVGFKLNYSADTFVLGAFVGPAAVALWAPAQRLTELLTRLTNQLNESLFPFIVDSDTTGRTDELRQTFVQGTRLSLAMAIPLAGGVALLAHPLIRSWIGPSFSQTATILQMLAALVVLRVGTATANGILKGAGEHQRLTAYVGITGVGNLALSIALVKPFGLVGVALGTILPVAIMAAFATFPRACRRVGLTPLQAVRVAVWPALWPAAVLVVLLAATASIGDARMLTIAAKLLVAALVYGALFVGLALSRTERARYLEKLRTVIPAPRPLAAAVARRFGTRTPFRGASSPALRSESARTGVRQ